MGVRQYNPHHFTSTGTPDDNVLNISDEVLGIIAGSNFTTPVTVTLVNAASTGLNTLYKATARKGSTATLPGFGASYLFELDNTANTAYATGRITSRWTVATAGGESASMSFATENAGGGLVDYFWITPTGQVQVGTSGTPVASAKFQIDSTTQGAINAPKQTTTQRDAISSPTEGLWVFNTTTHAPNYHNGTAWSSVGNVVYDPASGETLLGIAGPISAPGLGFRYDMGIYGVTQGGAVRKLLTWDLSTGSGNIITLGNTNANTVSVYKAASRASNGGHFTYAGTSGTAVDAIDDVSRILRVPMTIQVSGSPSDPAACAILDMVSTVLGALLPRMTTTQRLAIGSLVEGLTVWDTTLHRLMSYRGSAWNIIGDNNLLIGLAGSTTAYYGAMNSADTEAIAGNVTASAVKFHHLIDTTADRAIALPTAAAVGDQHIFEDDTGNSLVHNVTFTEQGGGTINGNSTYIESVPFFGRKARKKTSTTWVISQ